jgi:hypothetical protein
LKSQVKGNFFYSFEIILLLRDLPLPEKIPFRFGGGFLSIFK